MKFKKGDGPQESRVMKLEDRDAHHPFGRGKFEGVDLVANIMEVSPGGAFG